MRVLWISPQPAWPLNTGGAIRIRHLLDGVLRSGAEVTFVCPGATPEPRDVAALDHLVRYELRPRSTPIEKVVSALSSLPEPSWRARTRTSREVVATAEREGFDVIIAEHLHVAGAVAGELRRVRLPWVFSTQGVESRLNHSIASISHGTYSWRMRLDAFKASRVERRVTPSAAVVSAVSEEDVNHYRSLGARKAILVPNGVAVTSFPWRPARDHADRVLFMGTLGYAPNADACSWLANEIFPRVRARRPDATLAIVGSADRGVVASLHRPDLGVEVVGQVDDVMPALASADVLAVPLRAGHGTKIKILEALATGLTVVGTPVADQGLDLGRRGLILSGQTADQIATEIVRALEDRSLRQRLAVAGREFVAMHSNWPHLASQFADAVGRAASARVP